MTWLRLAGCTILIWGGLTLGRLFFMCVCQGVINPGPSSIHYSKWGEKAKTQSHLALLFFSPCYLSLFLVFFCFFFCPPCHKLTLVSTHCSRTPISFSPFLLFFVFLLWRRPYHFPAGRPLLSNCDEWLWLLYRFPNWNNLGTKQVAVYHIDFLNWV